MNVRCGSSRFESFIKEPDNLSLPLAAPKSSMRLTRAGPQRIDSINHIRLMPKADKIDINDSEHLKLGLDDNETFDIMLFIKITCGVYGKSL